MEGAIIEASVVQTMSKNGILALISDHVSADAQGIINIGQFKLVRSNYLGQVSLVQLSQSDQVRLVRLGQLTQLGQIIQVRLGQVMLVYLGYLGQDNLVNFDR